jgi:protein-S-isoprenylcysteine O-methyltransferase Ste14
MGPQRLSDKTKGNLMVVLQFVFLALIVFLPNGTDWPTPLWLVAVSAVALYLGWLVLLISAVNLGKSLTAHPVPLERATLKTSGLYKIVRHPIYLGLLLIAFASALGSGSIRKAIYFVLLTALLNVKARFEEKLLTQKYPEYSAYSARVGRLLPRLGSKR